MPHEEQRKLQQLGKSFCIFIPMPWIRYNKLKKGDTLTVISNEDILIKIPGDHILLHQTNNKTDETKKT